MSAPAHETDPLAGHLHIVPCTVKAAREHVRQWHRHLPEVQGGLFATACANEAGVIVAVGIAGNPPRVWQGTGRLVITRVAASVGGNACSMIYGALCRAADALGYREVWTYTLPHESGKTLSGAGFVPAGWTEGGDWSRPSRARNAAVRPEKKRRWVRHPAFAKLKQAWCEQTANAPMFWSRENPALGQCAVTALCIQDVIGGEIVRGLVSGDSHYWNRIGSAEIDLTFGQFPEGIERGPGTVVTRERLLDNWTTAERYKFLRGKAHL